MRTPWVLPPLPLPVVGAVRSAVLRCISLAGGSVLPQAFPLARVRRGRLLPYHLGGAVVTKGGALLPPAPPSGYGQRAIGDCWAGVAPVACGDDVPGVPLLVARRRVFPCGGAELPPRPRAAPVRRRLAAPSRPGSLPPSLLSPPGAALARPQSVAGRGRVSGDLPNVTRRIADARNRAGASLLAAAGGLKARLPVAASGRGRL